MTSDEIKGLIEEILYIWGEPLDFDDLSKILFDIDKKEIKTALKESIEERNNRNTGLIIRK